MAAPSSPGRSIVRTIFTGIDKPVAGQEKDQRWSNIKFGSPPSSPGKQSKVRTTAMAYEDTRIDYPAPSMLPSSARSDIQQENIRPTPSNQRTIAASAFQTPRNGPFAASRGAQPMATPPRAGRIAPPAPTPRTAIMNDAKAGFYARAKQGPSTTTPVVREEQQRRSKSPSSLAPTPFPTPARPTMAQGEASYERRELSKSVGPGSGVPTSALAPRPASVVIPSAVSPAAVEVQMPGMEHQARVEAQFAKLLDKMQVDATVRIKMLSTELSIKEAMLRSASAQSESISTQPVSTGGIIRPFLRKTKSALSLKDKSPPSSPSDAPDGFVFVHPMVPDDAAAAPRPKSRPASSSSFKRIRSNSQSSTRSQAGLAQSVAPSLGRSPTAWAMHLQTAKRVELKPSSLINLRTLLRNETPAWIDEWGRCGGYRGLLDRLAEVVELEWREEQHDDALLHEMLRCLKALTGTSTGRNLLACNAPAPFRSLVELLYGEKKPGDLAPRQHIIELVTSLFDVFPTNSPFTPPLDSREWRTPMVTSPSSAAASTPSLGTDAPVLPMLARATAQRPTARTLVRTLMIGPPDEKEEATVDFIRASRRQRVFKRWVEELINLLCDYFWIFCHSGNTFLRTHEVDETKLEAPTVPGGMTGGVESVAMDYAASHLRLVNAMLRSCTSTRDARQFIEELFESGMEKALLTLRKCSTQYYPHLHLELGRFVAEARNVGFSLPATMLRHLDTPSMMTTTKPIMQHKRSATEGSPLLPELRFG